MKNRYPVESLDAIDSDNYILLTFLISSASPIPMFVEKIAREISIGTYVRTYYESTDSVKEYAARIVGLHEQQGLMMLALPVESFDLQNGSLSHLLVAVSGSVFDIDEIRNIRLTDVNLPKKFVRVFRGPRFGIAGVRNNLKKRKGTLLIAPIHPSVGLSPELYAKICYDALVGGIDIVCDDELLVNPRICSVTDRIREITKILPKVEKETGNKKVYCVNVMAPPNKMVELAEYAREKGTGGLVVETLTTGLDTLRLLVEMTEPLPIRAYIHMAHVFADYALHGISRDVVSKLARLAGGDMIWNGTFHIPKRPSSSQEEYSIARMISDFEGRCTALTTTEGSWHQTKPSFPIIQPRTLSDLFTCYRIFGDSVLYQVSGLAFSHQEGVSAGSSLIRSIVDKLDAGKTMYEILGEKKITNSIKKLPIELCQNVSILFPLKETYKT